MQHRNSDFGAGTNTLTDAQLQYLPLEFMHIQSHDLPQGFPQPKEPRWPFSGGLTDYMRAVGPGVLVGRGWKQTSSKGIGFLYFLLVREP